MRFASLLGALVLGGVLASACTGSKRSTLARPGPPDVTSGASSGGGAIFGEAGGCPSEGACGTEVHAVAFDAPNIYFVLDVSGSMLEVPEGEDETRYALVRDKAIALVDELGALISVGAALFPHGNVEDYPCSPGAEVLPITPGDPYDGDNYEGPTTTAFRKATKVTPLGGTPVAATLTALAPKLAAAKGRTLVLLVTDGGPNCNPSASCEASECMPVLYGQCAPADGCCDPGSDVGGPALCVDAAATIASVKALADAGIDVHVIGVPDDTLSLFGNVLDALAEAGGAPQSGPTKYLAPGNLDELGASLAKLATDAISCEITLGNPPAEEGFTNVYFGCDVVTHDYMNGWSWTAPATISLNGESCIALKSGKIGEVKIISGCPTELPD